MKDYHEPFESMSPECTNIVRAISSLVEELEAVSWYHQRVEVCKDEQLKKILAHNRDEEIEHACMALEWLRRNMDTWDEELKTYLFSKGDITELEEEEGNEQNNSKSGSSGLKIGKL